VNRWRHRLTEINSNEAVTHPEHDVQNAQNVQNGRPSRQSVQIELIEQNAGLPGTPSPAANNTSDGWRERLCELASTPRPDDTSIERWACACRGVEEFARGWTANAMGLGWTFDELFPFVQPFANVSLQGAAWFVGDSTVTAVTADAITLRTEGEATQRIYRKPYLGRSER
jgi:hypothetical protein